MYEARNDAFAQWWDRFFRNYASNMQQPSNVIVINQRDIRAAFNAGWAARKRIVDYGITQLPPETP